MLVQIFASSAWTGVVWTIGAPNTLEQLGGALGRGLADAADDARQRRDLLEEPARGDPLGRVGDEHVLADSQPAPLLHVAGDELGRPGRDRRAQDQGVAGAQQRQQVVDRGAHLRRSLSTCENDGVPIVITMSSAAAASAARSASSRRPRREHAVEQLLGTRPRSNGIRPARIESSTAGSWSTPSTRRPRSAKRQRQRQADATEADHRDGALVAHCLRLNVPRMPLDLRPARLQGGRAAAVRARRRRHARQRRQPGLGRVAADLAGERDPVQPGDLALALDPGRMAGGQVRGSALRIRSRSWSAKCGVEAPISWRTSSTVTSRPGRRRSGMLGLAHFCGTASSRLSISAWTATEIALWSPITQPWL